MARRAGKRQWRRHRGQSLPPGHAALLSGLFCSPLSGTCILRGPASRGICSFEGRNRVFWDRPHNGVAAAVNDQHRPGSPAVTHRGGNRDLAVAADRSTSGSHTVIVYDAHSIVWASAQRVCVGQPPADPGTDPARLLARRPPTGGLHARPTAWISQGSHAAPHIGLQGLDDACGIVVGPLDEQWLAVASETDHAGPFPVAEVACA